MCCGEEQPAEYVKETNSGIVVQPRDYEKLVEVVKAVGFELTKIFEAYVVMS